MKWLVLGGGQLAKALEIELSNYNAEFRSLSHSQLDITDESSVSRLFMNEKPDVIINAAAWTDVERAETFETEAGLVNAKGPEILAKSSAMIKASFVQISTDYVFSGHSATPWPENAVVVPSSAYGRTKAEGEDLVLKAYAQGSFVVRTAWLYSQFGENFVKTMAQIAINESREVEVVFDQLGQPTSTYDLARQIWLLIEANVEPGIYHGTNSGSASWFDLARYIFELCGENPNRVKPIRTVQIAKSAIRPEYSVLGNGKWLQAGLSPMRDWRLALEEALPLIISALD